MLLSLLLTYTLYYMYACMLFFIKLQVKARLSVHTHTHIYNRLENILDPLT